MSRVPEGFLWGAATSAHQVEGNNTSSDWWRIEGSAFIPEFSGDAADHYHRYPEDMKLLADAGLNAYRFSIEWARIEPERDRWSNAELAHYRRMIEAAWAAGLEPVVTLHHFSSPHWFSAAGSFMAPDGLERWALYIEKVSAILDGVQWVCTINEPNMIAMLAPLLGLATAGHAADDGGSEDAAHLIQLTGGRLAPDLAWGHRLVEAHAVARRILRERTTAKVGWSVATMQLTPTQGNEAAFDAIRYQWEDLYLEATREDDYLGVQAYTSQQVDADGPVPQPEHPDNTLTGWAYRPDAIGMSIRHAHEVTPVPLLVTENGIATDDDERRIAYTTEALRHVTAAIDDGIDVRGYLHWSALDNYEWGRWAPTFGLIAFDHETFERAPKPSLAWLGEIARTGAAGLAPGSTSFSATGELPVRAYTPHTPTGNPLAPSKPARVAEETSAPASLFSLDSRIGDLLKDDRARAVVEGIAPGATKHPMLWMVKGYPLSAVASFAKDQFFADQLAEIDTQLRAIV